MNAAQVDDEVNFALVSIEKMYKLGMITQNARKTLTRQVKVWAYDRVQEIEEEVLRAFEGGKTL